MRVRENWHRIPRPGEKPLDLQAPGHWDNRQITEAAQVRTQGSIQWGLTVPSALEKNQQW